MEQIICYRDKNHDDRVVAFDAGYSDDEIEELLKKHSNWYRSVITIEDKRSMMYGQFI